MTRGITPENNMPTPTTRRKHADWIPLLEAQERSGQAIQTFCQEHGLKPASFQHHRSKWKRRQSMPAPQGAFQQIPASAFPAPIRVRLDGCAWSLELPGDIDPRQLRVFLEVLSA